MERKKRMKEHTGILA